MFAIDRQYLMAVARRSRGRALAIIGMALLAVVATVALAPPRYSATARVYAEQLEAAPGKDQTLFIESQIDVLGSVEIARRAVEREGLAEDKRFFAALESGNSSSSLPDRRRTAVQLIGQSLMLGSEDAPGVIAIEVTSADARISAKIANALANAYVASEDLRELDPRSLALRTSLASQLRAVQSELSASQRELERKLLIGHPARDLPTAGDSLTLALAAYDSNLRTDDLKREIDINLARYETLLDQYDELAARVLSTDAVLLEAARPARRPVMPDLAIPILAALAAGLATAAAVIVMRAISEDSLNGPSDVETKLGVPLLGLFPPDWNPNNTAACGSLVTNLEFAGGGGCPRSLVVASARPGEGAAAIARAVAQDLARHGAKVLLIDAYREHSGRRWHEPGRPASAATSRSGDAGFERPVTQDMTGIAAVRPDPERLSVIVEDAKSRYDAVIVNAPPVLDDRAAAAWAGACDGTLLVVGTSGNRRGAVSRTIRCKRLLGPSILGVVLTGFDIKMPSGFVAFSKVSARRSGRQTAFASHFESI